MVRKVLSIETVASAEVFSIRLEGELFASTVPRLAAIVDSIKYSQFHTIVLDFRDLTHIDSRGIGALVGWHRHFTNLGTAFEIVNIPEAILQPLRICNLDTVLGINASKSVSQRVDRLHRDALWKSYEFASQILAGLGEGLVAVNLESEVVYLNPRAEEILECDEEQAIGKHLFNCFDIRNMSQREFLHCLQTEEDAPGGIRSRVHREVELSTSEGDLVWTRIIFTPIHRSGVRHGTILNLIDITDEVHARSIGIRHLGRIENLRKISEIVRTGLDYEEIMKSELEAVLEIFECDRAWLLHPCDPTAKTWTVSIEATRPEFPGAMELGGDLPMTESIREEVARHLASPGPVVHDADHPFPKGAAWAEEFHIRGQMSLAIQPKIGKPWIFGLHQCASDRSWTLSEKSLFAEIAEKVRDSLSNLLLYQDKRAKEESLSSLVELSSGRTEGAEFYREFLRLICSKLGVSHGFIGVLTGSSRIETLAAWKDHQLAPDFSYDLAGTPCETVVGQKVRYYPSEVWKRFSAHRRLREMSIECYLGAPLFDSSGQPLGLIAVYDRNEREQPLDSQSILEVSAARIASHIEKQRAEEALFSSERENRAILGALPDPLIRIDRQGNVVDVRLPERDSHDPISRTMFENGCEALRGKSDTWEGIVALIRESLDAQEVRSVEFQFHGSHRTRSYEARISPCTGDEAVCLFRDISERKHAEFISRAENSLLELISNDAELEVVLDRLIREAEEASPGMIGSILLLDSEGKKLLHGAAPNLPPEYSREVDGIEIGPDVGSCGTAVHRKEPVIVSDIETDPLWKKFRRLALIHGLRACWSIPIFGARKDVLGTFAMYYPWPGTPDPFQLDLIHQLSHLAALAIEKKRSIEERARFEDQFQQTQKLESLGILAGGIAHDFNNLLVGILGNTGLAIDEIDPDSPVRETLRQVEQSAVRAADLTKQLLAYSGRGKFVIEPVNPRSLVEEMTHLLRISVGANVEMNLEYLPNTPIVEVDSTQLRQVVMNLIINASDSLEGRPGKVNLRTGGVELKRRDLRGMIPNDAISEGFYCFIEVADTGCGMDRETLSKIFDPFFTTKFTGRGLGLAAVLGIVRSHQGGLRVKSSPGGGSTFTLYLPSAGVARLPPTEEPRQAAPSPVDAEASVLVVDDEETVRHLAEKILVRQGFQVTTVGGGGEAIEMVKRAPEQFDVVLLDLTMPILDGEQTYTELMKIQPELRVVLSSGFSAEETAERFHGKPLAGYLQKPYRPRDLTHTIQTALIRNAETAAG